MGNSGNKNNFEKCFKNVRKIPECVAPIKQKYMLWGK